MNKNQFWTNLKTASRTPVVPPILWLVTHAASCGARMVPEDFWEELGQFLVSGAAEELPHLCGGTGWSVYTSHLRLECHEGFQEELLGPGRPGGLETPVWFIPVDEMVCMQLGDENAAEFVEVTRMIFNGSEADMRRALHVVFHNWYLSLNEPPSP